MHWMFVLCPFAEIPEGMTELVDSTLDIVISKWASVLAGFTKIQNLAQPFCEVLELKPPFESVKQLSRW